MSNGFKYRQMNSCKTWIDFPVVPDAVGINDVLEARRELVGLVEGRWSLLGLHPVEDGWHCRAAPLLSKKALTYQPHTAHAVKVRQHHDLS